MIKQGACICMLPALSSPPSNHQTHIPMPEIFIGFIITVVIGVCFLVIFTPSNNQK